MAKKTVDTAPELSANETPTVASPNKSGVFSPYAGLNLDEPMYQGEGRTVREVLDDLGSQAVNINESFERRNSVSGNTRYYSPDTSSYNTGTDWRLRLQPKSPVTVRNSSRRDAA